MIEKINSVSEEQANLHIVENMDVNNLPLELVKPVHEATPLITVGEGDGESGTAASEAAGSETDTAESAA